MILLDGHDFLTSDSERQIQRCRNRHRDQGVRLGQEPRPYEELCNDEGIKQRSATGEVELQCLADGAMYL